MTDFFYCLFDMSINTGTGGLVVVLGRYDLSLSNWNQSRFYEKTGCMSCFLWKVRDGGLRVITYVVNVRETDTSNIIAFLGSSNNKG